MTTTSYPTSRLPRTTSRTRLTPPLVVPPQVTASLSPTTSMSKLLSTLLVTCSSTSSQRATAVSLWASAWVSPRRTGTVLPLPAALLPLLPPVAAAAVVLLFPLTDLAAQARERVLDLPLATAALNTAGADHPLITAAPAATLPSEPALALVAAVAAQPPPPRPRRSLLMALAELRVVLLALVQHSVTAARSMDGADLLQATVVLDARADPALATRSSFMRGAFRPYPCRGDAHNAAPYAD